MAERTIERDIPSRLDRLAWSPCNWLVVAAPWAFGSLIGTGDPASIVGGYAFGAVLMLIVAAVA